MKTIQPAQGRNDAPTTHDDYEAALIRTLTDLVRLVTSVEHEKGWYVEYDEAITVEGETCDVFVRVVLPR